MSSAFDDFKRIRPSSAGIDFEAVPLPGDRGDYLAKGQKANPVFLLADAKTGQYHPSLQLRYLSADFQLTCRLTTESGEMEGVFALRMNPNCMNYLFVALMQCAGKFLRMPTPTRSRRPYRILRRFFEHSRYQARGVSPAYGPNSSPSLLLARYPRQ